jgi:DNA polymerase III delta prime subunit
MDTPIIDPYSPKVVDDIVGNSDTWKLIENKIMAKISPHLIICGQSGIGKSTFVRVCLQNRDFKVFTHNCIADPGLRDVRDAIRSFARGGLDGNGNHRWVVLEHADSLTSDTQAFLRRLLETASGSTRFIFEVRESSAISEPILSRSLLFNIDTPSQQDIRYEILRRTNHEISVEQAEYIANDSCGNVRIAINQALAFWKTKVDISILGNGVNMADSVMKSIPEKDTDEYGVWLCNTLHKFKKQGIDLRATIRTNMTDNVNAMRVLSHWNRPGGASSRSLWLYAMCV